MEKFEISYVYKGKNKTDEVDALSIVIAIEQIRCKYIGSVIYGAVLINAGESITKHLKAKLN